MTQLQIYNAALSSIGHDQTVEALTDATSEATWCNRFYDQGRREVLRLASPAFASTFETLDDREDCEHPEWDYQWPRPGDLLSIRAVKDATGVHVPYRLMTDLILTNVDEGVVEFVADEDDTDLFDPLFTKALIARLSADLAMPLTGKADMKRVSEQVFQTALADCRKRDSDDGRNVGFPSDANHYVTARG